MCTTWGNDKAMERFSTEALKSAGKAKAWNRIYSGHLAAADFIPSGEDFSAGLMLSLVGRLGPRPPRDRPLHDPPHQRAYRPLLPATLFDPGAGARTRLVHPGRQPRCAEPWRFRALRPCAAPFAPAGGGGRDADHPRPRRDHRPLSATARTALRSAPAAGAGLTPSAGAMIRSLWHRLEEGVESDYEDCLAHHMLEMIATSYAMVFGVKLPGESIACREMLTLENHVEDGCTIPISSPMRLPANSPWRHAMCAVSSRAETRAHAHMWRGGGLRKRRGGCATRAGGAHGSRDRALLRLRQHRLVRPLVPRALWHDAKRLSPEQLGAPYRPPDTARLAPVMKDAASDARNMTAAAASDGCPIRFIGTTEEAAARRPSSSISVSIGPGETALTRMPSAPTSRARPRVSASIPPLEAEYQT